MPAGVVHNLSEELEVNTLGRRVLAVACHEVTEIIQHLCIEVFQEESVIEELPEYLHGEFDDSHGSWRSRVLLVGHELIYHFKQLLRFATP